MTQDPPAAPHRRHEADPETALRRFLSDDGYPCLGARAVLRRSHLTVVTVGPITDLDDGSLRRVGSALRDAAGETLPPDAGLPDFRSTAVVFTGAAPRTEQEFERAIWSVLRRLAAHDTEPWADGVSDDPADPHFGFSFAGAAFFVVGLHPRSSRQARRSPVPTLVFNPHAQFEALRAAGTFDPIRDTIRRRDVRRQGTPNPMLADHGTASEARQYAGRAVPDDWTPPVSLSRYREAS